MHVQDDGIVGSFEPLQCRGEQIARDGRDNVFRPQPAIGAMAEAAVRKLASGIVEKNYQRVAIFPSLNAREWV